MEEPHWLVVCIIGASIGWSCPYIYQLISNSYRRNSPEEDVLKGEWFQYHISQMDLETDVYESKCTINPGLWHRLVFELIQSSTNLRYSGYVRVEKGTSQFLLVGESGDGHEEFEVKRFYLPLKSMAEIIYGIQMSYTHNKWPYASSAILSKKRLSSKKAKEFLLSGTEWDKGFPFLAVRPSGVE